MAETPSVRLDKWLWAVRVFKSRSLASEACRRGHVSIAGRPVKPSREVKIDDIIVVLKDELTRTYKVLQLLKRRVGAQAAREFAENQTPASEFKKGRQPGFRQAGYRPKGSGRPTKKERREIEHWTGNAGS